MFTVAQLNNMVLFDIETTSNTEKVSEQPEGIQEIWKERCDYLRLPPKNANQTDVSDLNDQELWEDKAPLHPEFGRIICISFGKLKLDDPAHPQIQLTSIYGDDEAELLRKSAAGIEKMYVSNSNTLLVGHNSERFDIPFISKRLIINSIDLPGAMVAWNRKPWDAKMLDTSKVWGFGSWQEGFVALKLLTQILGLPSPKDEMAGKDVYDNYWRKNNLEGIKTYCEKDVVALGQVLLRMAGFKTEIVTAMTRFEKQKA